MYERFLKDYCHQSLCKPILWFGGPQIGLPLFFRDHPRSSYNCGWICGVGAGASTEHCSSSRQFAGVVLFNLPPISGNWVCFSSSASLASLPRKRRLFESLNTLLRVLHIWVAPGIESNSDFKAHSLIIHIPYSQAVSEASRRQACFSHWSECRHYNCFWVPSFILWELDTGVWGLKGGVRECAVSCLLFSQQEVQIIGLSSI